MINLLTLPTNQGRLAKIWIACFLGLLIHFPIALNAQSNTCLPNSVNNGNTDLWSPDCYLTSTCDIQGNPCQANDVRLTGAFIADINGDPIATCTPGSTVNAFLWGNFEANAARFAVRSYAEILYNGVFSGLPQDVYNDCSFETINVGATSHRLIPVSFTCGQTISLANIWIAWDTNAGSTCANSVDCGDYPPAKCYTNFQGEALEVLIPNFSFDCGNATNEICFTNMTSGGEAPLSYLWDFGDPANTTSTLENPCFTYPSAQTYNAMLTVTDAVGVVASVDLNIDLVGLSCCEVVCPTNLNLGSFDCNSTAVLTIGHLANVYHGFK